MVKEDKCSMPIVPHRRGLTCEVKRRRKLDREKFWPSHVRKFNSEGRQRICATECDSIAPKSTEGHAKRVSVGVRVCMWVCGWLVRT